MFRSTFRRLQVTTLSMTFSVCLSLIIEIKLREGPMEGQQDRPISQHCLWMLWLTAFRN